ncbi:MAG: O-antigen ligase family protein [Oscillospiraceae bacterium]|nr:O-antigen ligase family protein [Oscillospiraceae bacterium]
MIETAGTEKRRTVLEVIYIIILAMSAMGDMGGFAASTTRAVKAISILIVIIGAGVLLISGNLDRVRTASRFTGVYAFVLIGIIAWSIFLWIVNLESIDFILRGTAKFMYQFLVLMIIFSATYLFGERAVYTTFYGIALANTIILLINLGTYGPVESFNSVVAMITGSGEQTGFTRAMEIHDITFTYGFFIIYFLFFAVHNKERSICIFTAVFYFLLGWKRIAMAALPVALFFGLILGRMKSKTRITFMKFIMWTVVILSFTYIVITRVGLFEQITDYFGLDTMGRNEIYNYIKKYYNISVGFMGYGFEYTTVILQQIAADNPEANIGVVALHNNILTVYIELGFVGFWAWVIYTFVFQLNWVLNHWGEKTAMLFFMCEMYIFITYTTDNTLYYFYTSLVLRLMPMAYAFHKPNAQDIRLWPWVKVQKKT